MSKPRYPIFVFLFSLLFNYILLPQAMTTGIFSILSALFMVVFSLSITCIVRSVVEQARSLHHTHSGISIVAGAFGISAFHACGATVCGYSLSFLILSSVLPAAFLGASGGFSILIISISIAIQAFAIYRMKCYRKQLSMLLDRIR